ncbi:MAG: DUF3300 domain-containing protein [Verrucomicrobia bacterium]|nr:DUF3300 domain-containing protein [Verrucomicrobiota bacterium]
MENIRFCRPARPARAWAVILAAILGCLAPLPAQIAAQPVPPPVQMDSQKLNAGELGQLLAPIALYPDALIALILPASTVTPDVVMAARYLKANGDPEHTESQPWDESVKSLARYPDVLAWMDENLEWTTSVGEAFVEQPADVMAAIQALREQAKAAGNLVDSPQQKVVEEEETIRIVPADPQVIYVPQYDPQVVYVQSYSTVPVLTFGIGFAVGSWLCYDFDWRQRCFYRGNWCGWNRDRHNNWNRGPDGNRCGTVNIEFNNASRWLPSAGAQRQANQRQQNNTGNARYVSARSGSPVAPQATRPAAVYDPGLKSSLPRPTKPERSSGWTGRPAHPGAPTTIPSTPEAGENSTRPERPRAQRPETTGPNSTSPVPPARRIPDQAPEPLPPGVLPQAPPQAHPNRGRPPTVPITAAPRVPVQTNAPGTSRDGRAEAGQTKQPDRPAPDASSPVNTPRQEGAHPKLPPPCPVAPDQKPVPSEQTGDKPDAPRTGVPPASQPTRPAADIQERIQPAQESRQDEPPKSDRPTLPVADTPAGPQSPALVVQPQPRRQAPTVEPVQQQERPAPVVQPQPRRQAPTVEPVQQQERPAPVVQPQPQTRKQAPTVNPVQQQRPQAPQPQQPQAPLAVQPVQQQQRQAPVVQPQSPSQPAADPRRNRGDR